jgi:beta-carotene 15,15'-dioxygenase
MFNIFIVLFVFAELTFYLLIAQTGIVEVFHSDIFTIIYLPIGGVLGTYLIPKINFPKKYKTFLLLTIQLIISFIYPDLSSFMLFMLGFAVGGLSPIIIETLKKATLIDLLLALGTSYTTGTLLFTTDPFYRGTLAILLTCVAMLGAYFLQNNTQKKFELHTRFYSYPLYMMTLWVFLDSSLFETLSRDSFTSIWRDGYNFEIIMFHILGVFTALFLRLEYYQKSLFITIFFSFSYLFYFTDQPLLLSIVYPFVISFYNVVILESLVKIKSLKTIGAFMVFIGWGASGGGLMVALNNLIVYLPAILCILLIHNITKEFYLTKGVISWQKD